MTCAQTRGVARIFRRGFSFIFCILAIQIDFSYSPYRPALKLQNYPPELNTRHGEYSTVEQTVTIIVLLH